MLKIKDVLYHQLLESMPIVPPETGGILGGNNNTISELFFDKIEYNEVFASYKPNISLLNRCIWKWHNVGIEFMGCFHTHPVSQRTLSQADKKYIDAIMRAIPVKNTVLYFPLIIPKKEIIIYKAKRDGKDVYISDAEMIIV